MENTENANVGSAIQQAVRKSAGDADKRAAAMDKSLMQKLVDYSTEGRGNYMPGFGSNGHGGIGTHNYVGHEGKLHGLSTKLKKYKKSATQSFITKTRAGSYLNSVGAIK